MILPAVRMVCRSSAASGNSGSAAGGGLTGWQAAKNKAASIVASIAIIHAGHVRLCLIGTILSRIVGLLHLGVHSIPADKPKPQSPVNAP